MRVSALLLKICNTLVTLILILCLAIAGIYSGYSLWDNYRIYADAGRVQDDLLQYKPKAGEDNAFSFAQLRAINPDVCAWVTMDETKIDHSILMGETNMTYLSKDVYGKFALAGSIFADSRNSRDFSDAYMLIYGHHMANHKMFGDLDLYEKASFFKKNRTGTLILPDRTCSLTVISCFKTDAKDTMVFEPDVLKNQTGNVLDYAEKKALHINKDVLEKARQTDNLQLLALSTCSKGEDDIRTIVLCLVEDRKATT